MATNHHPLPNLGQVENDNDRCVKSKAIDTNQLVASSISGKSIMEMSIDTDNDHVSSYGDVKSFGTLNLTAYCQSGRAVFNYIDYGKGGRNGWKIV